MTIDISSSWLMLVLLGAFHGINPGMGWLFAVGLGLQQQRRSAVWRALLPLSVGHAFAIAVAVGAASLFTQIVPLTPLKWCVAATLLAFGLYRLFRQGHPRYGGMQVGPKQLTTWSFLMATAHGAGLMVLPFLLEPGEASVGHLHGAHMALTTAGHSAHTGHGAAILAALPTEPIVGLAAAAVHTAGYLLVLGLVAVVVYERVGLKLLRTAWINIDLIWAVVLIVTAVLTPLL